MGHAIRGEMRGCGRRVEVALALIVACIALVQPRPSQDQVAQRLIGHLRARRADQCLIRKRLSLLQPACRDQPPYFRQGGTGGGVDRIIGPTRPEAVLVELQPLTRDAAEDHRAHPAIADRQGLGPRHAFAQGADRAQDQDCSSRRKFRRPPDRFDAMPA